MTSCYVDFKLFLVFHQQQNRKSNSNCTKILFTSFVSLDSQKYSSTSNLDGNFKVYFKFFNLYTQLPLLLMFYKICFNLSAPWAGLYINFVKWIPCLLQTPLSLIKFLFLVVFCRKKLNYKRKFYEAALSVPSQELEKTLIKTKIFFLSHQVASTNKTKWQTTKKTLN